MCKGILLYQHKHVYHYYHYYYNYFPVCNRLAMPQILRYTLLSLFKLSVIYLVRCNNISCSIFSILISGTFYARTNIFGEHSVSLVGLDLRIGYNWLDLRIGYDMIGLDLGI